MKILKTIEENEQEGLMSALGKRVTFFCMNYIYTGKLSSVNDVQVKLDSPSIVYETGGFADKAWKDAQKLPATIYLRLSAVEAYGVVK